MRLARARTAASRAVPPRLVQHVVRAAIELLARVEVLGNRGGAGVVGVPGTRKHRGRLGGARGAGQQQQQRT